MQKKKKDFFLRIDDTDKERSKDEFIEAIKDDLSWIGIDFKKTIKQSDRLDVYKGIFDYLKNKELIYPCFETSEELSLKRKILLKAGKPPIYDRSSLRLTKKEISNYVKEDIKPHWRLKLDDKPINWDDLIHGNISFDNLSISDPVVFRSDEMPLFTLTSVVDDSEFNISHILRGDDHITNTAAQIKLFSYLDAKIPKFGHFPLMRSKSGSGLSKREGSFSIREFKNEMISPLVLINYLNKIGTSLSIDEIENIERLSENFSLSVFSKNSVLFDRDDLIRLNSKHVKNMSFRNLKSIMKINFDQNFWDIIKQNINNPVEALEWFEIIYGKKKMQKVNVENDFFEILCDSLPNNIDSDTWSNWTKKILDNFEIKKKELYIRIRLVLTGKKHGPSMNELLTLFKREDILKRISDNCEKTTS